MQPYTLWSAYITTLLKNSNVTPLGRQICQHKLTKALVTTLMLVLSARLYCRNLIQWRWSAPFCMNILHFEEDGNSYLCARRFHFCHFFFPQLGQTLLCMMKDFKNIYRTCGQTAAFTMDSMRTFWRTVVWSKQTHCINSEAPCATLLCRDWTCAFYRSYNGVAPHHELTKWLPMVTRYQPAIHARDTHICPELRHQNRFATITLAKLC